MAYIIFLLDSTALSPKKKKKDIHTHTRLLTRIVKRLS